MRLAILLGMLSLAAVQQESQRASEATEQEHWIPIFNGRDLSGWKAKIAGHELGDNFADTFRVEDGVLKVAYDGYEQFENRFGHLFYERELSCYRLRVEYRFTGEQVPGAPDWALRNSGVMIHGQAPETMRRDQEFPVSIEVQLLGGDGRNARSTANMCTPGTNVVMDGQLLTRHCTDSSSATYHGDQWVTVEIEVRGSELVRHLVDGKPVLTYSAPQLDPDDPDAQRLLAAGSPLLLDHGTISLQSESHPVEFRRVELLPLEPLSAR
jgi:hypothetical protein